MGDTPKPVADFLNGYLLSPSYLGQTLATSQTYTASAQCQGHDLESIAHLGNNTSDSYLASNKWPWQTAMTWWNMFSANGAIEFGDGCTWSTTPAENGVYSPPSGFVTNVNCTNKCASAGVNAAAGKTTSGGEDVTTANNAYLHLTGQPTSDSSHYCPFTTARAYEWGVNQLLGMSNLEGVSCVLNPCYLASEPDPNGISSMQCTAPVDATPDVQAGAAAFTSVLSWQLYWLSVTCACATTTTGALASMCSGRGTCRGQTLVDNTFDLSQCSDASVSLALGGVYQSGTCTCYDGYTGPNNGCATVTHFDCSACNTEHGTCSQVDTSGLCVCNSGWSGTSCNTSLCPTGPHGQACNGNGVCNMGICACHAGFGGPACTVHLKATGNVTPPPKFAQGSPSTPGTSSTIATSKATSAKAKEAAEAAMHTTGYIVLGTIAAVIVAVVGFQVWLNWGGATSDPAATAQAMQNIASHHAAQR